MVVFNVFRNVRIARENVREIETWPTKPAPKATPGVVIRRQDGDAVIPTALQVGGSTASGQARYAVVRACADRLATWQTTGRLA